MIRPNEELTTCRHRRHICIAAVLLFIIFFTSPSLAQTPRLATGNWTRGLSGGWGHSWTPGYGKTKTDIQFIAFHPQLGRFVTDHLELYGEGSLFLYYEPTVTISGGLAAVGGRYHFWNDRGWTPYLIGIAGLIWNPLDIPELDRVFNFQIIHGAGIRFVPPRGPGLMIEFRNHHISNAGTAGKNLGINAATLMAGVQWVLR
jgi:hypothetical protein